MLHLCAVIGAASVQPSHSQGTLSFSTERDVNLPLEKHTYYIFACYIVCSTV